MKRIFYSMLFVLALVSCEGKNKRIEGIVFVDSAKLFESFQMKKDYDEIMADEMKAENNLIDSLTILLNGDFSNEDTLRLYRLRKDYYVAEQLFNGKFEQLSKKYTAEVNTRLNTYIKDFSKEKEYTFVLGSLGQGNVMYVDEENDVTEELIKYANSKYSN